jgi:hypothetical protein
MQTFLPTPFAWESAAILDNARLWKQRVDVKQILLALGFSVGDCVPAPIKKRPFRDHPVVKIWQGYQCALAEYGAHCCNEWIKRGNPDNLLHPFLKVRSEHGPYIRPPWMGDFRLHQSHKSNLIRLDPAYYKKFWPNVPDNLEYFWPPQMMSLANFKA